MQENGIRDIVDSDAKQKDDDKAEDDLPMFVDSNVAVNVLVNTAQRVNSEFQDRVGPVMARFGDFKSGPTKTVERYQSKVENEYQEAAPPDCLIWCAAP